MSGAPSCFSHISTSRDVGQLKPSLPYFPCCSINTLIPSNLMTLSQERDPLLVSTSPENVSTRHQGFAHARLRDPHLTGITCLFPQRSRQRLLTDAAWGGLKPAPEGRLRRACPSSSIQLRKPD